ncbi:CHY zinc finger protein [Metabacillus indicus]|uniref:CHY zinc finger protein n=1 Tax=Metabacillus indicus TaxID=246786 RepID=UPI002A079555|nr:CHY zinc finger protein [Metabacillus indicus]MDX8289796.1 CHY zinc finger protein [Metabacillus indicus]
MKIKGVGFDRNTRCSHYSTEKDIIAIKFKCCGTYYACFECHRELSGHAHEVWNKEEFDAKAIFCGNCRSELTIKEYMESGYECPSCKSDFNPGCRNHYHLYFEG